MRPRLYPRTTLRDPVQGRRGRRLFDDAATLHLLACFLERFQTRNPSLFAPRAEPPRLKLNELSAWLCRSVSTRAAAETPGMVPSPQELRALLTPFDLSDREREEVMGLVVENIREGR